MVVALLLDALLENRGALNYSPWKNPRNSSSGFITQKSRSFPVEEMANERTATLCQGISTAKGEEREGD